MRIHCDTILCNYQKSPEQCSILSVIIYNAMSFKTWGELVTFKHSDVDNGGSYAHKKLEDL